MSDASTTPAPQEPASLPTRRPAPLWNIPEPAPARVARAVARTHGLAHPLVAQILMRRGLVDDTLAYFLRPDVGTLIDPATLRHMPEAVRVVDEAIRSGRKITVYGDYDVDGTTGASLLESYLRYRGADVRSYIPMRYEGYGLSKASIEKIAAEQKPELILTVDCGTSSRAEADLARSLGMEIVVTDHHLPTPGKETSGIVVNPHVGNQAYENKALAGVAVGYKLVSAMHGSHPLANLDLVALGTIADVMSLTGENRVLVRAGLERLAHTKRTGLIALLRTITAPVPCGHGGSTPCFPVSAEMVAFQVGPRINAIGRMGLDPMLVVELFTTSDEERAAEIATMLDTANKERRLVTNKLVDEAMAAVDIAAPAIVLQMDVFKGLAGLVAGRLASEYGKPTIIIDREGHGSARSVEGVDLLRTLQGQYGHLVTAAGHSMAMGISNVTNPEALRTALEQHAWPEGAGLRSISIDAVCDLSDLDRDLLRALKAIEPTGAGNAAPLFAVSDVVVDEVRLMSEGRHAKLRLAGRDGSRKTAIWFNHGGQVPAVGDRIDVAGRPVENTFRGETAIELQVTAVRQTETPLPLTLAA
jgi:single-stranded-DNA-specific exonuclease